MADNARDIFLAGLRDAYALEKQALDTMESQANRLEDYPAMRERAARHADETRMQLQRLDDALNMMGTSPSAFKDLATRTAAMFQGLGHSMATDEVIKDTLAGYAFEHFEIASYRALIQMAEDLREPRIAESLRQSLEEEEAMAAWIDSNLENTVRTFVQRTAETVR